MTTAAEVVVEINGRKTNLESILRATQSDLQRSAAVAARAASTIGDTVAGAERKAANEALQFARALSQLQARAGDTRGAMQTLATAIAAVDQSSKGAIAARTQLVNLEQRYQRELVASAGGTSRFAQVVQGATGVLGGFGLALGGASLVQYGLSAATSAQQLDRAQNVLRSLSGSTEAYNDTLAIARQQQILFGGTLQSNIEGLSGLAITARQSGADLEKLVDLSQRLGTLDPAQGTAGARIALSEALAGDITSLAKRYEIPRAALRELQNESLSTEQRLLILDQYLNQIGITSEVAAGSVSKEAQAFNALGAAIDSVTTRIGAYVSGALAPAAQGTADFINSFSAESADGIAAGVVALESFSRQLAGLPPLTTAAAQAERERIASMLAGAGIDREATIAAREKAQADADAALQAASRTAVGQSAYGQLQQNIQAEQQAEQAIRQHADAVTADAAEQLTAQAASQELALRKRDLEAQARAAANALLASGASGAATAARLANSSSQVDVLTAAYYRLAAAQAAAGAAERANIAKRANTAFASSRNGSEDIETGQTIRNRQREKADAAARDRAQEQLRTQQILTAATGDETAQIANLRKQQQYLNADSQEYARVQAQIIGLEKQRAAAAAAGGGGGGTGRGRSGGGGGSAQTAEARAAERANTRRVNAAAKTESQLTEAQIKGQDKRLDALQTYTRKVSDIETDFYTKRENARRDFEQTLLETDADVYAGLIDLENQNIARQFDAQYQSFLQGLPAIAQEKGTDVAEAYAEAYEQVLLRRARAQQDIEAARAEGNTDRATALEGVEAKRQAAENRRLQEILDGRNSLRAQEQQALGEAANDYAATQEQIGEVTDRNTDRITRASDQRIAAMNREAAQAGRTAEAYARVGAPEAAPTATTSGTSTATPPDATLPADATVQALSQLAGRLDTVIERVTSVEAAVREAGRGVEGAVRSSGGKGALS